MAEFEVGDRVRVRALPGTAFDAGRVGAVVAVERGTAGDIYLVRLDADPARLRVSAEVPFLPGELDPVPTRNNGAERR